MNLKNDIENKYNKIKAQNQARKRRFIQRKKELGHNHISSLWIHLDTTHTEILKEKLKNASTEQLLDIINFLSYRVTNNHEQEEKWSTKALLDNELIKYIKLKQINQKTESLNSLSIRLMKMGISNKSRKTKKRIKFSTSSLSRMIKKIEYEMKISD